MPDQEYLIVYESADEAGDRIILEIDDPEPRAPNAEEIFAKTQRHPMAKWGLGLTCCGGALGFAAVATFALIYPSRWDGRADASILLTWPGMVAAIGLIAFVLMITGNLLVQFALVYDEVEVRQEADSYAEGQG